MSHALAVFVCVCLGIAVTASVWNIGLMAWLCWDAWRERHE